MTRHMILKSDHQGIESLVGEEKGKYPVPPSGIIVAQPDIVEYQALKCFVHSEPIIYRCAQ
jgi:hypothetical protein